MYEKALVIGRTVKKQLAFSIRSITMTFDSPGHRSIGDFSATPLLEFTKNYWSFTSISERAIAIFSPYSSKVNLDF